MSKFLAGVVVPMVTPVTAEGAIDTPSVARLVEHLVTGGVDGIFVLGTTGEALSVPQAERERLVAATVAAAQGRVPVVAGIAANCFAESRSAAQTYTALGVAAVVAHLPFYYPLTDEHIEHWFLALADTLTVPLLLYNIPQTTHQNIAIASIERLRQHPQIVGIKDSSPDEARIAALLAAVGGLSDFTVLIGAGPRYAQGLRLGADGIVPSTGNLAPALCHALCTAPDAELELLHQELLALTATYQAGKTLGESLAALKALLSLRGLCGPELLLPLRRAM
jgi:dihydrodipicolinate synthase/N-acetylneuraminate lyase